MSLHNDQEQDHQERIDRHREDINWVREECRLLREGLQEQEDVNARLTIQLQNMSQRLRRCQDRLDPPISALGSPQLPPYPASPSLEYSTPPIEVRTLGEVSSAPHTPEPVPVPPPAPQSPISFSDAENIPPACCANPPATRAPLVPITEVQSDAEDSDNVAERLEEEIAKESALRFLNGSNQGRGARRRAVHALNIRSAPYPHSMRPGVHPKRRRFLLEAERLQFRRNHCSLRGLGGYESSSEESTSEEDDCVLLDRPPGPKPGEIASGSGTSDSPYSLLDSGLAGSQSPGSISLGVVSGTD